MKFRWVQQTIALLLSATMLLPMLYGCGKHDNAATVTTLTIMSWNDDFRELMEKHFIPSHAELMENVRINWISCEISDYQKEVQKRLADGEHIDLFLGDDKMAPAFANDPHIAALNELGITKNELSEQYRCTKTLASDEQGVQKGSAFSVEPGVILYRTDYAEQYFGITDQDEMAERFSTWADFSELATTLHERSEGKVKLLTGSAEIWLSIDSAMSGHWLSDGRLAMSDETVGEWLNYIKQLDEADAFLHVNSFDDSWYEAVSDGVFCFFSAPWLNKSVSATNADIITIFSAAKNSGRSFGKWKTAPAPCGFSYGGSWLYASANSVHKELAGEIIRSFTCNADFMRHIALANMTFVNNISVIQSLSEDDIPNPLFDGLDAFSVYHQAAWEWEPMSPSVYDQALSKLLYHQTSAYNKGQENLQQALYNFRYNAWKKFDDITDEPQKPVQTAR